jgi:PIN domain nuclease of toxin-antitoxin system
VNQALDDGSNDLFLSSASLWEMSIKIAKGKLSVPDQSVQSLYEQVERLGIAILSITRSHILRTETLPHLHGDPFDRMIIAQALEEGLTILTSDGHIARYDVSILWE